MQRILLIHSDDDKHTQRINLMLAHQVAFNLYNVYGEGFDIDIQEVSIQEAFKMSEELLIAQNIVCVIIGTNAASGKIDKDLLKLINSKVFWLNNVNSNLFLTIDSSNPEELFLNNNSTWLKFTELSLWKPKAVAIFAGASVKESRLKQLFNRNSSSKKLETDWEQVNYFAYYIASQIEPQVENNEPAQLQVDNELLKANGLDF